MLNKPRYRWRSKALQRICAVNAPPMANAEHCPAPTWIDLLCSKRKGSFLLRIDAWAWLLLLKMTE
jgi:hypothetical protein